MGECKVDHSPEDVRNKYANMEPHLPDELKPLFGEFLAGEHTQEIWNEVFHLLKKYDLASGDDREEKNNRLYMVLRNV